MIHQGGKISDEQKRDEFLDWVYDLEFNIFKIPEPDKTIFLNVSPEMSQKLVLKKDDREYIQGDEKMDIHEADKNHLINAWKTANYLTNKYDNWIKIDCENNTGMRSIDEIHDDILNEIL